VNARKEKAKRWMKFAVILVAIPFGIKILFAPFHSDVADRVIKPLIAFIVWAPIVGGLAYLAGWLFGKNEATQHSLPDPRYQQSLQSSASLPIASAGRPAGFWKRFMAFVIDQIVLLLGAYILIKIFGEALITEDMAFEMARDRAMRDVYLKGFEAMGMLMFFVVSWLYYVVMESSRVQATLGKLALELKVTDLNGARIGLGRANGRFFSKVLSNMTLGVGYVMIAFTAKKQGLHDLIAGTLVVERDAAQ